MANSNLQDKILELAQMEQKANAAGKARDVAKQKVRLLEGDLKEFKVKIAKVKSVISTWDNETASKTSMIWGSMMPSAQASLSFLNPVEWASWKDGWLR